MFITPSLRIIEMHNDMTSFQLKKALKVLDLFTEDNVS